MKDYQEEKENIPLNNFNWNSFELSQGDAVIWGAALVSDLQTAWKRWCVFNNFFDAF